MQKRTKPKIKREITLFLIVVLGFSLFLKLYLIQDNRDFWHDESFQYLYSEKETKFILDSNDVHPPLYNLMTKFFLWLGINSIEWLRYTSVVFSLFFLTGFFGMIYEFFNKRTAMVSTTLLAFSYTYLYYATEFRNYSFVLMLTVFQIYYFNKQLKEGKGILWYLIFSVLMIYSHYLSALIILVQLFYLLLFDYVIPNQNKREILQSWVWLFALSMPLVLYAARTFPKIQSFWFNNIDIISLLSTFFYFLAPPTETIYGFGLFYVLLLGTMIYYRKKINPIYVQFCLYLVMPVVIMWGISQVFPFYHHRYFLFGGIGFFVLVAWGIDKIAEKFKDIHHFFIGFWIILVWLNLSSFTSSFNHEISDSAIALQNQTMNQTDIIIIHTSTFSQSPYKVYLPYADNYLITNLTEEQLFTAGGSVVEDYEIIRKITEMKSKNLFAVSDRIVFDEIIWSKGGLYVTKT
jgi:uncharacterized membrane protein